MKQLLLLRWLKLLVGFVICLSLVTITGALFIFTPSHLDDPTPQADAYFGFAVAGVGDVNGDEIPDFLVGAPHQDVGDKSNQGQAFVFSGATNNLLLTLDNPISQAFAYFGTAVAGVEDINGDGVADLMVGVDGQNVGNNYYQGQAFVYSGVDGSLLLTLDNPTPQSFAYFGSPVAEAGDVNGDGTPDLLVGAQYQNVDSYVDQGQAFVFSGTDGSLLLTLDDPTPQAFAYFGNAVAGVEDINGDEVVDLLVGAHDQDVGNNNDQGQAFVFSGTDGSLILTLDDPIPQETARFGSAVAGAGDVNGDGVFDLLVGAYAQTIGGISYRGQVFVFSGIDGSLIFTLNNPTPNAASFGYKAANVGDVNGDGLPDFLVGAHSQTVNGNNLQGQAYVFSGSDGRLLHTLDDPTPQAYAYFGFAVAGAGDVNSDGLADLLVGAYSQTVGGNEFQGKAFVFVSGESGEMEIQIDIQPGSDPNIINLEHTRRIQVALLSAGDFDAPVVVNEDSLTFGRTGDEDSLLRNHGVPNCRALDVNVDGLPDLVCAFRTQRTGFVCSDTVGTLHGMTLDGTLIAGQDSVVIEPCRP